jgi:hypothetical protein
LKVESSTKGKVYSLSITLAGLTSSLGNSISLYLFCVGRLLFLEVPTLLCSSLVGRLLFWGVLPLFNGVRLSSKIFSSSMKGCLGGKIPPAATKNINTKNYPLNKGRTNWLQNSMDLFELTKKLAR